MTQGLETYVARMRDSGAHPVRRGSPANISPLVVWLASAQAADVTGRVFNVKGGAISVAETWMAGPGVEQQARWTTDELGAVIPELLAKARQLDGSGHPRA